MLQIIFQKTTLKLFHFSLILFLASFSFLPEAFSKNREIKVSVGKQRVIKVKKIRKIAIGDPQISDVKAIGRTKILVIAKQIGTTSMIVFHNDGSQTSVNIRVIPGDTKGLVAEILEILGPKEGIRIRAVGEKIILDGKALTADDFRRVEMIKELYPNTVSFVSIDQDARRVIARELNRTFQESGLKNVVANVYGSNIFLEGSVANKFEMDRAEKIVKSLGEEVENLIQIGLLQMVLIEVDFVELKKGASKNIGINWPMNLSGTATSGISANKLLYSSQPSDQPDTVNLTTSASLSSDMNFQNIFTDGYVRVLARPKLICASGEKAKFLSGGEIPIPIVTDEKISIEWKEYGIKMDIEPNADRQGNITVKILAEVSEIDKSTSISVGGLSVPGFSTGRAETNVSVQHGETIALSGLFANNEQKDVTKIPGLGHIPILGELFKSRSWREKKSELTIFVTPRLVTPYSKRVRQTISDIKTRYKEGKSIIEFSIFD